MNEALLTELLALLESLAARSATEQEVGGLRAALPDVPRSEACGHCALVELPAYDAAWHLTRCERHPERLRYQSMHRLTMVLSGEDGFVDELRPLLHLEFEDDVIDDFAPPLRDALVALQRAPGTDERLTALATVTRALKARLHVVSRARDACPWCSGVFPLEGFIAHLSTCRRNPAATHAAVLRDALLGRYGEARVTQHLRDDRLAQALVSLRRVLDACAAYEASMGWEGGSQYYTKVWSERPFKRELHRAERVVIAEREEPYAMSPALDETLGRISVVAKQSWSFWNGMSDGERGKSIIEEDDCTHWSTALQAVRRGAGLA